MAKKQLYKTGAALLKAATGKDGLLTKKKAMDRAASREAKISKEITVETRGHGRRKQNRIIGSDPLGASRGLGAVEKSFEDDLRGFIDNRARMNRNKRRQTGNFRVTLNELKGNKIKAAGLTRFRKYKRRVKKEAPKEQRDIFRKRHAKFTKQYVEAAKNSFVLSGPNPLNPRTEKSKTKILQKLLKRPKKRSPQRERALISQKFRTRNRR